MVNPFICGSGNFHHQLEEDDEPCSSPCSTPRKGRKSSSCSCIICRGKDSKNPYARLGRDKFFALLAELEEKRQKIYTQLGAEDISSVRFVCSSSNDCKPVVVMVRDKKQAKNKVDKDKDKPTPTKRSEALEHENPFASLTSPKSDDPIKTQKENCSGNMKMDMWTHQYFVPLAIIILILLFLTLFGRSFAILWTSLGLYLLPTIKVGGSSNVKRPRRKKKKEYARMASDQNTARGDIPGVTGDRKRVHGRSWRNS